jgi:predicted small lipoprotein YifL
MRTALPIVLASALLAACGQRGALYLPDEQRDEVARTAPAAPVATPITPAAPVASPIPAPDPASADERESDTRRNRSN